MEIPDTENIAYMDEYPHIEERLRVRRLCLGQRAVGTATILRFREADTQLPNLRLLMEQPPQVSTHSPDDSVS
jgi:hypothetical protein